MTTTLEFAQNPNNLEQVITEAIAEAREACSVNGSTSAQCAVAWDIVEELQAEKADRHQATKTQNSLEVYCNQHPEAVECLIYDV